MQFTAVTLLALATAAAALKNSTTSSTSSVVSYTTVTVDTYVTVCPVSQAITYGSMTYTNTETVESTITLPCPCTLVTPVYVSTSVVCNTCPASSVPYTSVPGKSIPASPTPTAVISKNATVPVVPGAAKTYVPGSQLTAGASGNTIALSGASLAGLIAIAAYVL